MERKPERPPYKTNHVMQRLGYAEGSSELPRVGKGFEHSMSPAFSSWELTTLMELCHQLQSLGQDPL